MTTFLLVISLLLNGIAIFSIILLYTRQNRLVEVEKTQKKMEKEMEEVMSTFLVEMKAENAAFIEQFSHLNQPSASSTGAEKPNRQKKTVKKQNSKKQTASRQQDIPSDETAGLPKADRSIKSDWAQKTSKGLKQQAVKAYKSFANPQEDRALTVPDEKRQAIQPAEQDTVSSTNDPGVKHDALRLSEKDLPRDLFVNQIVQLQKQGCSIEEIAKKLNRGKTEIELLLKFN